MSADERYFKVVLSAQQHAALTSAAESAREKWDGTEAEDIDEQDALAGGIAALNAAEEVV